MTLPAIIHWRYRLGRVYFALGRANLVKVGFTTIPVGDRIAQLNDTSPYHLYGSYRLLFDMPAESQVIEREIHQWLASSRAFPGAKKRELFRLTNDVKLMIRAGQAVAEFG